MAWSCLSCSWRPTVSIVCPWTFQVECVALGFAILMDFRCVNNIVPLPNLLHDNEVVEARRCSDMMFFRFFKVLRALQSTKVESSKSFVMEQNLIPLFVPECRRCRHIYLKLQVTIWKLCPFTCTKVVWLIPLNRPFLSTSRWADFRIGEVRKAGISQSGR